MPHKPPSHNAKRLQENRKAYEKQRGSARERGYTAAWDEASKEFLRLPENRLCVRCKARGINNLSECTDHKKPARYFPELFWLVENWQGLCAACNAAKRDEDGRMYGGRR